MRGTYLLLFKLDKEEKISIGRKGAFLFPAGFYVYVGSHMRDTDSRIARHARKLGQNKKPKWHIDFLREKAILLGVVKISSNIKKECEVSREFSKFGKIACPGFGSSDCNCPTHLWYFDTNPAPLLRGLAWPDLR